jgi:hypothetical protein
MATATIRIDQATHTTQPAGVAGRARDDIELGEVVTLRSTTNSGVTSWRWTLRAKPTASAAVISNPVVSVCTFTPDVEGTYLVRLEVNDGLAGEKAEIVIVVRDADGLRIPAAGEDIQANWLIDGVPNARGWHPDLEAWLLAMRDGRIVYDIDFTLLAGMALTDGANTLGDREWTGANIGTNTDSADVVAGTGLSIIHIAAVATEIAGADDAPRLSITLSDLIEGYDPAARYLFLVEYSWTAEPDAVGERFSIGFYAPDDTPWQGCALRFAGASSVFLTTDGGDAVTHEGERDNTYSLSMAMRDEGGGVVNSILGVSLDGPTTLTVWHGTEMPSRLAGMQPVVTQRIADPVAGGDHDIFAHPDVSFVMALATTLADGEHWVVISSLRVIKVPR